MKTLFDTSLDKIVTMVQKNELSLREIKNLDITSERAVMEKLLKYDHQLWRRNIMKSLARIEIDKCQKFHIEWEKIYIDGMRDFMEVLYILHDGDEKYLTEEELEWTEDEFEDDYIPVAPVKRVDIFHEYYNCYLDAIYKDFDNDD